MVAEQEVRSPLVHTSGLTKACNERGGFHARATPRRMKRVPVSDMGLNQRAIPTRLLLYT